MLLPSAYELEPDSEQIASDEGDHAAFAAAHGLSIFRQCLSLRAGWIELEGSREAPRGGAV